MQLVIDDDLKAVAEFMQGTIPTNRLVSVASELSRVAPVLWGRHPGEEITALRLVADPISAGDQHM